MSTIERDINKSNSALPKEKEAVVEPTLSDRVISSGHIDLLRSQIRSQSPGNRPQALRRIQQQYGNAFLKILTEPGQSPLSGKILLQKKGQPQAENQILRSEDNSATGSLSFMEDWVKGNPSDAEARELMYQYPKLATTPWRYLNVDTYEIATGGGTAGYNCIGHSVGMRCNVELEKMAQDLGLIEYSQSLDIFDRWYALKGFPRIHEGSISADAIDIALFSTNGKYPTHAAVKSRYQPFSTPLFESKLQWTSLIVHTLEGINGGAMGSLFRGYSRK